MATAKHVPRQSYADEDVIFLLKARFLDAQLFDISHMGVEQ